MFSSPALDDQELEQESDLLPAQLELEEEEEEDSRHTNAIAEI